MKNATTKQMGPHVNCRSGLAWGVLEGSGRIQLSPSPCIARKDHWSSISSPRRHIPSTIDQRDPELGPYGSDSRRNSPQRTNGLIQLCQLVPNLWLLAGILTDHEPPDSGFFDLGKVRMRPLDYHLGSNDDCCTCRSKYAKQDWDRPLVRQVVGNLDLEGVVVVVSDHQWGTNIHWHLHHCHDYGGRCSIDPIDQLMEGGRRRR